MIFSVFSNTFGSTELVTDIISRTKKSKSSWDKNSINI